MNPADILRAKIEFYRLHIEEMKRENKFRNMLTKNADVVNGTSPATIQAVREVFAENVKKNNKIENMVLKLLEKSEKSEKPKISNTMMERMMKKRRAKNARARVDAHEENSKGLAM